MVRSEEMQRSPSQPSLLSTSKDAEVTNNRILSVLDSGAKVQSKPNGSRHSLLRGVLLVGFLCLGGAGAWMIYHDTNAPTAGHSSIIVNDQSARQASKPTLALPLTPLPANPLSESAKEVQVATIVNEPNPIESSKPAKDKSITSNEEATSKLNTKGILSEALEAGITPQPSALKNVVELSDKPDHKMKPAKPETLVKSGDIGQIKTVTPPKENALKPVALVKPDDKSDNKSLARHSKTSAKPKSVEAKVNGDSDVNLLEAIVAHSTGKEADLVAANAEKKSSATSNHQKAATKKSQASQRENTKSGARNTDIVERKPGDTTEGLLQRCRQLGFFEGELCRWRICSGLWSVDAACKSQQ